MMYKRPNLFVPKTAPGYEAMLNLATAASSADFEMVPDGVRVPYNVYMQWAEVNRPMQSGSAT